MEQNRCTVPCSKPSPDVEGNDRNHQLPSGKFFLLYQKTELTNVLKFEDLTKIPSS